MPDRRALPPHLPPNPVDRSAWDETVDALEYAWGPALVAALFATLLALADPTHEVIAAMAEGFATRRFDPGDPAWRGTVVHAVAAILMTMQVPVAIYLATRRTLGIRRAGGTRRAAIDRIMAIVLPRLPMAGGLIAVLRVLGGVDLTQGTARWVIGGVGVYLAAGLAGGVLALMLGPAGGPRWVEGPRRLYRRMRQWMILVHRLVGPGCLLLLVLLAVRPDLAAVLGPLAIVAAFVIVAAAFMAWLTVQSCRLGLGQVPLVFLLVGGSLAGSSAMGLSLFVVATVLYGTAVLMLRPPPSAPVRRMAAAVLVIALGFLAMNAVPRLCDSLTGCSVLRPVLAQAPDAPPTVADTFAPALGDIAAPPIIVAAQGGGLFAAYATGMYLAHRADTEGDAFTGRLLAVSGVSGGSIGAATYWAVRQSGLCAGYPPNCHADAVHAILAQDYLSPVVATLLTRDLADLVVPLYWMRQDGTRLDRGRVLEATLARHADAVLPVDGLMDRALAGSGPDLAQGVPALFLNATDVHSGQRIVFSPLHLGTGDVLGAQTARRVSVAQAAVMSARFPVVTPPARLADAEGVLHQIVDGGYFDNSGIETVHDLWRDLRRPGETGPLSPIRVVALAASDTRPTSRPAKGMLAAPLSAFTAAWNSRRLLSLERFEAASGLRVEIKRIDRQATDRRADAADYDSTLTRPIDFTLSWYLGDVTLAQVRNAMKTRTRESLIFPAPSETDAPP